MADSATDSSRDVARVLGILAAALLAAIVGFVLLYWIPGDLTDLLGILLTVALVLLAVRIASRVVDRRYATYNVAEVEVAGPITRDGGGGPLPTSPTTPDADDVVEQIERADEDPNVRGLLLKLNTPGGEVVPSDDIRLAAMEFDGPTVAYTTDLCASGGMWIASGCDELWARDASLVGSIGVRFSQTRFADLADRYGISYERIVSGDYKDSLGAPFKELEPREREYLQGLSDSWYDNFVERVAEAFDMTETAVRDTEARVFLGEDAVDMGLVTAIGTDEDAEERVGELIGAAPVREVFEPQRGIAERFRFGAASVAYALGAGAASVFAGEDGDGLEL